jgi:hypothetical protein
MDRMPSDSEGRHSGKKRHLHGLIAPELNVPQVRCLKETLDGDDGRLLDRAHEENVKKWVRPQRDSRTVARRRISGIAA